MKIFRGIETYSSERGACVTTGTFDGVHIGHRKIISKLNDMAESNNMESVMVTFDPHPRRVLFPDQTGLQLINTLEEKLDLLESTGISTVIVHPFTMEFSRTSALIYVRDLLVNRVGMKKLVIGYDHQFGKNREGSIDQLRELAPLFNFEVDEIPAQEIDDVNISSTKIRHALREGDVHSANSYLGYDFYITGKVVKGQSRGHGLGFPTANILIESSEKIIPAQGVYAVEVVLESGRFKGMANIGVNPTFGEENEQTVEVNIFDFNDDIYGKSIRMSFRKRIRSEMRFDNVDELIQQMQNDKKETLSILA
ncbi:MAG: bifunctional riboflavin kinase/FAD synthetase [Flavobacteriales bacterium]